MSPQPPEPKIHGDFSELKHTRSGRVSKVIDGLTLLLSDKSIVRLSSLDIPDYADPNGGEIMLQARQALEDILPEGTEIMFYQTRNRKKGRLNRMGHQLAHLQTKKDEIWINGVLLSKGLARAFPSDANPEMAVPMYEIENTARSGKLGLWGEDFWPALTVDNAQQGIGHYQVVEGLVRKSASVKNNVYLNFGPDWKTDFSVMIKPPVRKTLARAGLDPLSLSHKTIRVRGYLRTYNGPLIELEHAAHLELIPEAQPETTTPSLPETTEIPSINFNP